MKLFKESRKTVLKSLLVLTIGFSFHTPLFAANERDVELAAVTLAKEFVESKGSYQLMTVDELKAAIDGKEDFLLIDTMRYEPSYKLYHIPGAVNFTFPSKPMLKWDTEGTEGKTEDDFIKLLGADKNRKIIVYCGFVMCPRSHVAMAWIQKLGYTNVYRVPGGVNAWRDSGYKLSKVEE